MNEKVDVVFVGSDLHKMHLMSFTDSHAHLFQSIFHVFRKNLPSVLRRAHYMVEQKGLVVPLKDVFAHPSYSTRKAHHDV